MDNSKTYLNVPFSQKDDAKSLGARWDPSKKKWYAPSSLDITLFKKWNKEPSTNSTSTKQKTKTSTAAFGTITNAKDKNFIAYSNEQPPWN